MCDCPECGADLRDKPIPVENLHMYGGNEDCETCDQPRHFSKLIGVYDLKRDMTVEWMCPMCEHTWPRG